MPDQLGRLRLDTNGTYMSAKAKGTARVLSAVLLGGIVGLILGILLVLEGVF